MGEQNTGTGTAGDESYIFNYDTYADLLANNWSSYSATQIDWVSSYSTVGLAYDGVYRLMGEQDTATHTAGNESVIYTYNTYADLLANNWSSSSVTQIDWNGTYSTVGLDYDGAYRLMGEQDTGTGTAGNESYIYTYNTFADLLANNWSSNSPTQINWNSSYSTGGLVFVPALSGDGNGDGWVDGLDYLIWAAAFGTHPGVDGDISDGDYNDDGWVDGLDYLLWAGAYGNHSATAVPEPTTAVLTVAGVFVLAFRRRRA
ncbi:MAG: PEP-CTERM sorting domain-containing protein [Pirellulales bacterium]